MFLFEKSLQAPVAIVYITYGKGMVPIHAMAKARQTALTKILMLKILLIIRKRAHQIVK